MPTLAHRSIRHCLQMIGPFSPSDRIPQAGQKQFYAFITGLYQAMLLSPERYFVFPAPYEAYMSKKTSLPTLTPEKHHKQDSRESTLRNIIQQSISFYPLFLRQLGLHGKAQGDALLLSLDDYQAVLHQMRRCHDSKYNEERFRVLEEQGFCIAESENAVRISHKAYPQMMQGLLYLCADKDSKYALTNYLRLDFKNAGGAPSVSDICRTLPEDTAAIIHQVENALSGLNLKAKVKPLRGIVSDFQWKVEYTFKGKNIFGFYGDYQQFLLCLYFNDHQLISAYADQLLQENSALFDWFSSQFPERLCTCPYNRRIRLGSVHRRICGLSNRAEVVNPSVSDVENALIVLKQFRSL